MYFILYTIYSIDLWNVKQLLDQSPKEVLAKHFRKGPQIYGPYILLFGCPILAYSPSNSVRA